MTVTTLGVLLVWVGVSGAPEGAASSVARCDSARAAADAVTSISIDGWRPSPAQVRMESHFKSGMFGCTDARGFGFRRAFRRGNETIWVMVSNDEFGHVWHSRESPLLDDAVRAYFDTKKPQQRRWLKKAGFEGTEVGGRHALKRTHADGTEDLFLDLPGKEAVAWLQGPAAHGASMRAAAASLPAELIGTLSLRCLEVPFCITSTQQPKGLQMKMSVEGDRPRRLGFPTEAIFSATRDLSSKCKAGDAKACVDLGELFELAKNGVPRDYERALILYRKACALKGPKGCHLAGWLSHQGLGTKKDTATAKHHYEKGCALGYVKACGNLGSLLVLLQERPSAKDMIRGHLLLKGACEKDNPHSCLALGRIYAEGRGALKSVARAASPWCKACRLGIGEACRRFADELRKRPIRDYLAGAHERSREDRANALLGLYDAACKAGDKVGCTRLRKHRRSYPRAVKSPRLCSSSSLGRSPETSEWLSACPEGAKDAALCAALGVDLREDPMHVIAWMDADTPNPAIGKLFLRSCKGGDPVGCSLLQKYNQQVRAGIKRQGQ